MPKIDPASITVNTIRLVSPDAQRTIVPDAVTSIEDIGDPDPKVERSRITFDIDLGQLYPGTWNLILNASGVLDVAGNSVESDLILYSFPVIAPVPTTDTSTGRSGSITVINFTAPAGYTLSGFINTRILTDEGRDIGGGVTTSIPDEVTIPIIGTPMTYTLVHGGTYADGTPWTLTETLEILPPVIPFTEKLAVRLEGVFPERLTLGNEHPPLDFTVVWISPAQDDPAADSQIDHASVVNAIALIDIATGARFWPDEPYLTIARNGRETTVSYRAARAFYAGTWALTALAGAAQDEAGRTLPENIELARLTAVDYIPGAEQWSASNPPNPVYPRVPPASNNDLMGRIESVVNISNFFDLGLDVQVNMSPVNGMEAVEDIRLTPEGFLCVTAKVGQDQQWRLQNRFTTKLLTFDNDFEIDVGTHNGQLILFFSNSTTDEIPTVTYEGGLTQGTVNISPGQTSAILVLITGGALGVARFKARNFDTWDFEGVKNTVEDDGSDRSICLKQTSLFKYFEISARPRQSATVYADGEVVRIPVGRTYWDVEYRVDVGEISEFKLFRDEAAVDPYPGNSFGWLYQSFGYRRYFYRVYDLTGEFFVTPTAIRAEIQLSDGQVWRHSMTIEAAAFRPPAIYPLNFEDGGSLPQYNEIQWHIGNPNPDKTLTNVASYGITPTGQGQGGSYGSSGATAATVTFRQPLNQPGQYGAAVTYTYSDGTSETHQALVTSESPPPEPPDNPYLFVSPQNASLGTIVSIFWASSELPTRDRETVSIEVIDPINGSRDYVVDPGQFSSTVQYIPRRVGTYRATATIKYVDWSTQVSTDLEFTGAIPSPPQNFTITPLTGGALRMQWQEPGIAEGQRATAYYLLYREPNGNESEQRIPSAPEQNAQNHEYRYWDGSGWDRTLEVAVVAEWNGQRTGPSAYVQWVHPSERTLGQQDSTSPPDLLAVTNAIAAGPQAGDRAQAAGDSVFSQTGNGGQALNTFLQTYSANTYDYWISVRDSTDSDNLRAVATANANWLFTPGQPGLLDALRECVGNGISQACTFADNTERDYLLYLQYVANATPDTVLSIVDWHNAGRPTE